MIYLFLVFWVLVLIRIVSRQVYFWQLKEYRLDRMRDFLRSGRGKKEVFNVFNLLTWLLLVAGLIFLKKSPLDFFYLTLAFFGAEVVLGLTEFLKRKFRRPKLTLKAGIISGLGFLIPIFLLGISFSEERLFLALSVLFLLAVLPFLIFLLVLFFKPITFFLKRRVIKKAKRKIKNFPHLKVIGITGSFGKTSTKEFLAAILTTKFKVLKTEGRRNTDIGVAQTVLTRLKKEHEVFVAEMGAYKKGEIKAICDLVHPQMGILTGINEQHLALFGTLENLKKTKFELIESLPQEGRAIFNRDNEICRELAARTRVPVVFYSQKKPADLWASKIKLEKERINFKMKDSKKESVLVNLKLLGIHQVSNFLAAAAAAKTLGFSLKEIACAAAKLKPLEQTMKAYSGIKNSVLIDDTYNANPDGVLAALEYLKRAYPDYQKILIMQSLLELGAAAAKAHQKIGAKIADVCDLAILLDRDYARDFLAGSPKSCPQKKGIPSRPKPPRIIFEKNPKLIFSRIKNLLSKKTVILFESRGAEAVLENLKQS